MMNVSGERKSRREMDFLELTHRFASKLIYVVGNARGGSTFANTVFGTHPRLLEVRWNDKFFSDIWPNLSRLTDDALRQKLLRQPKYYSDERAAAQIGAENVRRLEAHVKSVCQKRDLPQLFCLQGILFWIMRGAKPPLEEIDGWCLKANTWEGVDLVKQAMPEARLIFVERDPRSTALSHAKVEARRRREQFTDADLVKGALSWLRNAAEFAVRLRRYPGSYVLFYEQLVNDPTSALNKAYQALGMAPIDKVTAETAMSDLHYKATTAYGEARSGISKPSGIQRAGLDRWRNELSAKQLQAVCALTFPGAHFFGYEMNARPGWWDVAKALARASGATLVKSGLVYCYCRSTLAMASRHAIGHSS
jgi:hypothetical protein